jgi:putative two-component system response regulator
MAIADVYDALTSTRPYKKAFSHEEAVKIILEGKGTQFDPVITDLFGSVAEHFCR